MAQLAGQFFPTFVADVRSRWRQTLASPDAQTIRRVLFEFAPRHWKGYAIAIVLACIMSAATATITYLLGQMVNEIYLERNFPGVVWLAGALTCLCLVKGFADYGQAHALAIMSNRIVAEAQRLAFKKLLTQNLAYFANRHSSEFMWCANHGGGSVAGVMRLLVLTLGRDVVTLIGLVAVMVWQDPMLSAIGFGLMPLAVLGVRRLMVRASRIASTQFTGVALLQQTMADMVQGLRVIKTFNLEQQFETRAERDILSAEQASNKLARVTNRSAPLVEALGGVAIALVCLYGGYRMLETNAAPGEFVAFMTAFLLSFDPARRIARLNVDLAAGLTGVRVLLAIIDAPATEPDDSNKSALVVTAGQVEFRDTTFGYVPDQPVIERLSFAATPGGVTALVGPSGAGKSTIFNLLLDLYSPSAGDIRIDGQRTTDVTRTSLRDAIAYMGQDVFLFRGSIRENILLGRADATDEDMIRATKAAFAHDFIMALPHGYDTAVGELGVGLSTGQRQRIAIARALIKNAPIVLLDEPTAALDSISEHNVQAAIRHLCAGRTTIVAAHRLNTIQNADKIIVLDGGRICEQGRHHDLMQKNGRYAELIRTQFASADDPAGSVDA